MLSGIGQPRLASSLVRAVSTCFLVDSYVVRDMAALSFASVVSAGKLEFGFWPIATFCCEAEDGRYRGGFN
jgi:hypothetical protein